MVVLPNIVSLMVILVHVIPDSLSYEQAALTEPAAVAVYAVRQSALKAGDTAVIFGLGPIGL